MGAHVQFLELCVYLVESVTATSQPSLVICLCLSVGLYNLASLKFCDIFLYHPRRSSCHMLQHLLYH